MKSVFKTKDLDENTKMFEVDGFTFTIGYNWDGEVQVSSSHLIKVRQPEINPHAVFMKLGDKVVQ